MLEALPLADQPHLLQPTARREELFGAPRQPITIQPSGSHPAGSLNSLEVIPTRLGLSTRTAEHQNPGQMHPPLLPLPATTAGPANLTQPTIPSAHPEVIQEAPQNLSLKDSDPEVIEISRASSSSVIVSPRRAGAGAAAPIQSVIVRTGSVRDNQGPSVIASATPVTVSSSGAAVMAGGSSNSSREKSEDVPAAPSAFWLGGKIASSSAIATSSIYPSISSDLLLGRWRLTLDLFGRVFIDDVGTEAGSVIAELGGFPVKEARFRREMERLRNMQQRDLTLFKMDRERGQLIIQTFKELNTQYNTHCRRATATQPSLAVSRVKVTFKDEPGEGSGVARSFYTAVAEAILSQDKLPNLDAAQVGAGSKTSQSQSSMVIQFFLQSIHQK